MALPFKPGSLYDGTLKNVNSKEKDIQEFDV